MLMTFISGVYVSGAHFVINSFSASAAEIGDRRACDLYPHNPTDGNLAGSQREDKVLPG